MMDLFNNELWVKRRGPKITMYTMGLKWGEKIPYFPGTENLMTAVECYTVYMPQFQEKLRAFGVEEQKIPTMEEHIEGTSRDGVRKFLQIGDGDRDDIVEAHRFGSFWTPFYNRLGPCETPKQYAKRTKLHISVVLAHF